MFRPLRIAAPLLGALFAAALPVAPSHASDTTRQESHAMNPHPTIRALSGATPIASLEAASTALLVIDFQNEYFTGAMPIPSGEAALRNAKRLVAHADAVGIPVVHVQHVAPAGSPLFAIDGETVQFHPDLQPRAQDTTVRKTTVSVFASTDLDAQLKARGIRTVIVAGLMTHACVAGAARDAVPLGYRVLVASDASATRDIARLDGDVVDHRTLHRAALVGIEDTLGDVASTADIIALPVH